MLHGPVEREKKQSRSLRKLRELVAQVEGASEERTCCEVCDAARSVTVEPLQGLDMTGRYRGGEMVYTARGFIVCTLHEPSRRGRGQQVASYCI